MMLVETTLGRIGIVHASGFANAMRCWTVIWEDAARLGAPETEDTTMVDWSLERRLGWRHGEHFAEHGDDPGLPRALPGIDLVITGHSPGARPRWARRNVLCIDTGVHYAEWGHLTVA